MSCYLRLHWRAPAWACECTLRAHVTLERAVARPLRARRQDYLFVPINEYLHWSLVIIIRRARDSGAERFKASSPCGREGLATQRAGFVTAAIKCHLYIHVDGNAFMKSPLLAPARTLT
eukprot:6196737-Pleurochrysis_carterae.AAC.2